MTLLLLLRSHDRSGRYPHLAAALSSKPAAVSLSGAPRLAGFAKPDPRPAS